jgi:type II secretion system protein N
MALRLPNPGPRMRKVLRYLGFAVLGLVTFVFAFQMTFPFDRVKDKIVELLAEKYEVSIGSVERGFVPGRMYFKAVTLRTRPAKADEVATTFYIEQLEVDLGLLALLRSTAAVKLDAKIGSGHIKGAIALAKDGTSIDLVGYDLPSANLPVREALGLPMSGKIRFAFNLELPNEKSKSGKIAPSWVKAEGRVELACPSNCVVGDGKTKLKFNLKNQRNQASQAFAEGGIDFGKVNIDSLFATAELKDGKLDLTKLEAKSGDGELHIDFNLALNQDLNLSTVTGCLRFNVSPAFLKRDPKTGTAISATGAPLGPDNLFHIKLEGTMRDMRRLGVVCGAAVGKNMDNPGGVTPRPNLTVTPETPAKPPVGIPPPLPMPPPPPAAVPEDAGVDALHVPTGPNGEMPAAVPTPAPPSGSMEPPPGVGQ